MAGIARRKKTSAAATPAKRARKSLDLGWKDGDEDIESSDSEDDNVRRPESLLDEDSEEEENVDVKRVRLARQYLEKIEARSDESSEEEDEEGDDEEDVVGRKLQRERLKQEGTLERELADKLKIQVSTLQQSVEVATDATAHTAAKAWVDAGHVKLLRGHDLTPTCVDLQPNGDRFLSGSKDHTVVLWDTESTQQISTLCTHWKNGSTDTRSRTLGEVLSVAMSDDGRYAAVGKRDGAVRIFDIRAKQNSFNLVKKFEGHKSAVTSLAFRSQSLQLFSASDDRCIRHYNLEEMLYIETLYGHQFGVTDIDCHRKEMPISVGKDRTARAWKLTEDTHLIYRGGGKLPIADCVSVIKDDWFLTGHVDGQLCLWLMGKKRPVVCIDHSHGLSAAGHGNGVVSASCLPGSDIAATGSCDGYLRFWKASTGVTREERNLESLCHIPIHGFINSIAIGPKSRFCIAAVGQEHRNGRWIRVSKAKNRLAIVNLQAKEESDGESDDPESASAE